MSDKLKKCCDDITKYNGANPELVAAMMKTYQLVLSKPDTRMVACSDPAELETVKKNFLIKKLGLKKSDEELDALIADACQKMKASRQKNRLTFYYLLVEATNTQSVFV
ncbi:MAG: DUF2853 family protein [Proteobacteria bacterium]|nr:DUF2853 family protein [Pseudomonadota bacterium]